MRIDLTHNIILKETLTENFEGALRADLLPKLVSVFGAEMLGLQMYEDYLADDFSRDGYWYYPMTVLLPGGQTTQWVKWNIMNTSDFLGGVPYTFCGNNIDFIIADDVPAEFISALEGRAIYFEGGYVRLNVTSADGGVTFLRGRFSQSFIDEMTRQLSADICRTCGVSGLADSTIELDMVFAPESYMEHTSENVTYRRLLMSAKGCAPRDFWIKWRKRDGAGAYSCASHVFGSEIEFSIGEDVPHKLREKEYRYLVKGNSNKYQAAMGKKNITEWRELVKRALKRGELIKTTADEEVRAHSEELADKVSAILERFNIASPVAPADYSAPSDDIADIARAKLDAYSVPTVTAPMYAVNTPASAVNADYASYDEDVADIPVSFTEDISEYSSDDIADEDDISSYMEDNPSASDDFAGEVYVPPIGDFDLPGGFEEPAAQTVTAADNDGKEVDILRARLSDEMAKRNKIEQDYAFLKSEMDMLEVALRTVNAENENLKAELASQAVRLEELKAQLELEAKERVREKALFAEATRLEREQAEKEAREREAEQMRRMLEEQERERMRIQEREREAEEERLRLERERIEASIRSREDEKRDALERAAALRKSKEDEALARMRSMNITSPRAQGYQPTPSAAAIDSEAAPEPITPDNHPYTSVSAKLIFRYNVDPNIKANLHEIISLGLSCFKKEHVYIKLKASIPEPTVVLLDFVKFPMGEEELLRGIINLIGNSDLGVSKIIVE